jgi:hypothetical protein
LQGVPFSVLEVATVTPAAIMERRQRNAKCPSANGSAARTPRARNVVDLDRIYNLDSISEIDVELAEREEERLPDDKVVTTDSPDCPGIRSITYQNQVNRILAESLDVEVILLGAARPLAPDFEGHPMLTDSEAEEILEPPSGIDDDLSQSRGLESQEKGK